VLLLSFDYDPNLADMGYNYDIVQKHKCIDLENLEYGYIIDT